MTNPIESTDAVCALVAQNLTLAAALQRLSDAVSAEDKNPDEITASLEAAQVALAATPEPFEGYPDFRPIAKVISPHSGWRLKAGLDRSFQAALSEEFATLFPTVRELQVENDLENGDEGQCYASFSGAQLTFKSGEKLGLRRDNHGDEEFTLIDGEELLRADPEILDEAETEDLKQVITKFANLFGVEERQEKLVEILDGLGAHIASFYEHAPRDGGRDTIFLAPAEEPTPEAAKAA